ncbi:hypothetical protein L2E82_53794 [Cichorium intybus]|nr:hypothetical protein L2E82_53794 [Cichorium intybus]
MVKSNVLVENASNLHSSMNLKPSDDTSNALLPPINIGNKLIHVSKSESSLISANPGASNLLKPKAVSPAIPNFKAILVDSKSQSISLEDVLQRRASFSDQTSINPSQLIDSELLSHINANIGKNTSQNSNSDLSDLAKEFQSDLFLSTMEDSDMMINYWKKLSIKEKEKLVFNIKFSKSKSIPMSNTIAGKQSDKVSEIENLLDNSKKISIVEQRNQALKLWKELDRNAKEQLFQKICTRKIKKKISERIDKPNFTVKSSDCLLPVIDAKKIVKTPDVSVGLKTAGELIVNLLPKGIPVKNETLRIDLDKFHDISPKETIETKNKIEIDQEVEYQLNDVFNQIEQKFSSSFSGNLEGNDNDYMYTTEDKKGRDTRMNIEDEGTDAETKSKKNANGGFLIPNVATVQNFKCGELPSAFMRILMEMSAGKEWLKEVKVYSRDMTTGERVLTSCKIEYAWNPSRCSHCKIFGHNITNCSIMIANEMKEKEDKGERAKLEQKLNTNIFEDSKNVNRKNKEIDEDGFQRVERKNFKDQNRNNQLNENQNLGQGSKQGYNGNYQKNQFVKNGNQGFKNKATNFKEGRQKQKWGSNFEKGQNSKNNNQGTGAFIPVQGSVKNQFEKPKESYVEEAKKKNVENKKVYVPKPPGELKISSNFEDSGKSVKKNDNSSNLASSYSNRFHIFSSIDSLDEENVGDEAFMNSNSVPKVKVLVDQIENGQVRRSNEEFEEEETHGIEMMDTNNSNV